MRTIMRNMKIWFIPKPWRNPLYRKYAILAMIAMGLILIITVILTQVIKGLNSDMQTLLCILSSFATGLFYGMACGLIIADSHYNKSK